MRQALSALAGALEREQDRWFLWVPVLFGCGIAAYFALSVEPPLTVVVPALAGALLVRRLTRESLAGQLIGACLVAGFAGLAVATVRTAWVAAPVISGAQQRLDVSGWLELIEPTQTGGARITIGVAAIDGIPRDRLPTRLRLRVRALDPTLAAGDAVRLKARVSPPPGPAMPGGFDFARQAWFDQLGGVGSALAPLVRAQGLGSPPPGVVLRASINRARARIGQRLTAALPGETGAIANALVTGERGAISEATNTAFRNSGLFHVLSISGLHMAIMAGAVFVTLRLLLTLVPALALRFPIKKWAAVGASLGALGYLLISGGTPPTVRSYLMISIMFLAVLLDRPALALRNVALSALAILIVTPESLVDISFQMSYAAVVALIASYEAIRDRRAAAEPGQAPRLAVSVALFFGGIILSTLIASAAVAPFGAYHFHKSQQYAVLANLMAIPVVNIVIMPAALASLIAMPLGLEGWPLLVMGWGIEIMVWCARVTSDLPGSVLAIPALPNAAFVLMLAGGIWLALWRTGLRHLGWLAVLAGLALAPFGPRPDLLVSRDGSVVAVRALDGRLWARADRGGTYELGRWLESDGDKRTPNEVLGGNAFRCDGSGCTVRARGGGLVAVARRPEALRDDCGLADVVVTRLAAPTCKPRLLLIDRALLAREGALAVTFAGPGPLLQGATSVRGQRPWSTPPRHVRRRLRPRKRATPNKTAAARPAIAPR